MSGDGEIDERLRKAGEDWRAGRDVSSWRVDPSLLRETRRGTAPARAVASLVGVIVVAVIAVLVVVSLPQTDQHVAVASPSSSPSPTIPASVVPPTASPTDPREVLLTGSDAIGRVVAFVGAPELTTDLTVQGPNDGPLWRFYSVQGSEVHAAVNAHDGSITSLLLFANVGFGGATIDADRAVEVAEEFLHQHQVPFDGLDRTVRFQYHGETSEYVVEWIGHQGEIILPNSREVGVDASTGLVFRYTYVNHPYDPPAQPLVDRATAEAVAVRVVSGSPRAQLDSSELRVTFAADDVQRLVWQVYVTEGFSHWVVEVDAETGAAAVILSG